ncbi:hypothetical protein ACA910_015065 [Epithemia clementina (nom. ined.)]
MGTLGSSSGRVMDVLAILFVAMSSIWMIFAILYACSVFIYFRMRAQGLLLDQSTSDPEFGRLYLFQRPDPESDSSLSSEGHFCCCCSCCRHMYIPMGWIFRRLLQSHIRDQERRERLSKTKVMSRGERREAVKALLQMESQKRQKGSVGDDGSSPAHAVTSFYSLEISEDSKSDEAEIDHGRDSAFYNGFSFVTDNTHLTRSKTYFQKESLYSTTQRKRKDSRFYCTSEEPLTVLANAKRPHVTIQNDVLLRRNEGDDCSVNAVCFGIGSEQEGAIANIKKERAEDRNQQPVNFDVGSQSDENNDGSDDLDSILCEKSQKSSCLSDVGVYISTSASCEKSYDEESGLTDEQSVQTFKCNEPRDSPPPPVKHVFQHDNESSGRDLDEDSARDSSQVCPICLSGFDSMVADDAESTATSHFATTATAASSTLYTSTTCCHAFHQDCILDWLCRPATVECPCCRVPFFDEDNVWQHVRQQRRNKNNQNQRQTKNHGKSASASPLPSTRLRPPESSIPESDVEAQCAQQEEVDLESI